MANLTGNFRGVRIPKEVDAQLRRAAERRGVTLTTIIVEALREALDVDLDERGPRVRIDGPTLEQRLIWTKGKSLAKVPHNVNIILRYHPEWQGVTARGPLAQGFVLLSAAPWREHYAPAPNNRVYPLPWTDGDTLRLQAWIFDVYGTHMSCRCIHNGLRLAT